MFAYYVRKTILKIHKNTLVYETLHRELKKNVLHEPDLKPEVNSGIRKGISSCFTSGILRVAVVVGTTPIQKRPKVNNYESLWPTLCIQSLQLCFVIVSFVTLDSL